MSDEQQPWSAEGAGFTQDEHVLDMADAFFEGDVREAQRIFDELITTDDGKVALASFITASIHVAADAIGATTAQYIAGLRLVRGMARWLP